MILAAGLSPAWQQILAFDRLELGEVNRAAEAHWCASGKSLNVALALHFLGTPCRSLCLAGGHGGAAMMEEFRDLGIPSRWIETNAHSRVCTTLLDRARKCTTELVENAPAITPAEQQAFIHAFEEEARDAEIVVLSGSLPRGVPVTFYRDLMERTRARVLMDARGEEMLNALDLRPLLVKPNREELGKTVGRTLKSDGEVLEAMRELVRRGAEWVVITAGPGRVFAASAQGQFQIEPPRLEAVNPIGSGDSLAAGIAWGVAQGWPMVDAVRFGVAAAGDNVTQLLPARLGLERIRQRLPSIKVLPWQG